MKDQSSRRDWVHQAVGISSLKYLAVLRAWELLQSEGFLIGEEIVISFHRYTVNPLGLRDPPTAEGWLRGCPHLPLGPLTPSSAWKRQET